MNWKYRYYWQGISINLKKDKLDRLNLFLAVSSGFLLTLSFPKTDISLLSWFALVPLFVALTDGSAKNGFYLGLCAGLAHYLTLVYWLAYTMTTYGNLPFYVSVPVLFLLSTYLALYLAIFSMALTCLCSRPLSLLFMSPLIWVSLEYIRSFLFTGFPWGLIGHTQFNRLNIIQITDIFGVYGVSFCILLSNVAVFLAYLFVVKKNWQKKIVRGRLAAGAIITFAFIFCLVWFYGKYRIQSIHKLVTNSSSVKITIIQGNIDQAKKWDPAFQRTSILKYINLSRSAKKQKPNLVVWPETATPFYLMRNTPLSKIVLKGIHETNTDFLIGSPSYRLKHHTVEYYNSAYLIDPEGNILGKYDKSHLVPFGEYIPFKKWLPFIGKMVEGVGDFRPGEKGHTIQWGKYRIGMLICYEIIFPNLSRAMIRNNAAFLVNITNDAWYGKSSAPYQHFSMAVFRAVENRRSIIRAANTGISGFIDPSGRVIAATPIFKDAAITRTVSILQEKTFYSRYGDVFAVICLVFTLISTCYIFIHRFVQKSSGQR